MLLASASSNYAIENGVGGGNGGDLSSAASNAKSTLLSFQMQMYDLEDLFANAEQTEFLIVTIPTELAVKESMRLVNDLTFEAPDMPIRYVQVCERRIYPLMYIILIYSKYVGR